MPPNVRDIIQPETITMFDKFGELGWKFVSDNILRGSTFNDKIKIKHRTLILKKIIMANEPNQTKLAERMKKFEQDPEFKWKLLNNFENMKNSLLYEYQQRTDQRASGNLKKNPFGRFKVSSKSKKRKTTTQAKPFDPGATFQSNLTVPTDSGAPAVRASDVSTPMPADPDCGHFVLCIPQCGGQKQAKEVALDYNKLINKTKPPAWMIESDKDPVPKNARKNYEKKYKMWN